MKFLRVVFVSLSLFASARSFTQINCNFVFTTTLGDSGCVPFLLRDSATGPTANVVSRVWQLTTCNNTPIYSTPNFLNPTFAYILNTPGCYCLRLTTTDNLGNTCTNQVCNISVADTPSISGYFTMDEGCSPLTTQATLNITANSGSIDSTIIDWGCGPLNKIIGNPPVNILHNYACLPACYDVTVITYNSYGCLSQRIFNDSVCVIQKPSAHFVADITIGYCTNSLAVKFTADSTPSPNLIYKWYINGILQPNSNTRIFNHTFAQSVNCYDVKLVVSHSLTTCADSATYSDFVCVYGDLILEDSISLSGNYCIDQGTSINVTLRNTTPGFTNHNPKWQLIHGSPPIVQTVFGDVQTVTLTDTGCYTVLFSGVLGPGCSDSLLTPNAFCIQYNPSTDFTISDTFSCTGSLNTTYTATPCAGCTYQWTMNGSTPNSATTQTANAHYNNFGNFSVSLSVTNSQGCTKTLSSPGIVKIKKLQPEFSLVLAMGCAPLSPQMKYTNTHPIDSVISVEWWVKCTNGQNFHLFNPNSVHSTYSPTITSPACCDITLWVRSIGMCLDSASEVAVICAADPPSCTVQVSPDTMCYEADTVFFSFNCGLDTIDLIHVIDFGDGQGGDFPTVNIPHVYTDVGTFTAQFVPVKDSCYGDTIIATPVTILAPAAKFIDSTSCLLGDTVFFVNQTALANRYHWDFQCVNVVSDSISPKVVMPRCTNCNVYLTAWNDTTGCVHIDSAIITTACVSAEMLPGDTMGCAPFLVKFKNNSASISTLPGSTKWDWDISTGVGNPWDNTFSQNPSHSYLSPGIYIAAMRNVDALGCVDTLYDTITVCGLIANINSHDDVCLGTPLCFSNVTDDTICQIVRIKWDFGVPIGPLNPLNDDTSNLDYVCYTYPDSGTYLVRLDIWNENGCKDTATKTVTVGPPMTLLLDIDDFTCVGKQQCIINQSTGANLTYNWQMPNGTPSTSTLAAPCVVYNAEGEDTITVTITSNGLCSIYDTLPMHVFNPVCSALIDIDTFACPFPTVFVQCTNYSVNDIESYAWDFGDNTPIIPLPNPTHGYSNAGSYIVTLTVVSEDSCVSTCIIDTVLVKGPSGNASFQPTPGVCLCDSVTFTINTVEAISLILLSGCNLETHAVNPISPIGTIANPTSFTYSVPYCIVDTCFPQILIGDTAQCNVFLPMEPIFIDTPTVYFTFNNYGVCIQGNVCFHDSSYYHVGYPDTSYTLFRIWDWGDGSSIDTVWGEDTCHYYDHAAAYYPTLTVVSSLGCVDSITGIVVVVPLYPIAEFAVSDTEICQHDSICFTDLSWVDPNTALQYWIWDYGDNTIDTAGPNVCHQFNTFGNFFVRLTVIDSIGCGDDTIMPVTVIYKPLPFIGNDTVLCYGVPVTLTSGGNFDTCHWYPANLFGANANNCTTSFTPNSNTTIVLYVANNFGCNNTDTINIIIDSVIVDFLAPDTACLSSNNCFTDQSYSTQGVPTVWNYSFGDNATAQGQTVCHYYSLSGNYTVTLTVFDNLGCYDSLSKVVVVVDGPAARFSLNDTAICAIDQICVTDLSTPGNYPIASWEWSYGDNSSHIFSQTAPCYTYSPPYPSGYDVILYVTDITGCADTATIFVILNELPTADFNNNNETCEDEPSPFTQTSIPGDGPLAGCEWLFWVGNPTPVFDNNCNTSYHFPYAGTFQVQLVVKDVNGCTDTIVKNVLVDSLSQFTIRPGDTTICLGESVGYTVTGVFNNVTWTPSVWLSDPNAVSVTINPLGNISYIVRAVNGVCDAVSDTITVSTIQPIPIECSGTPDRIVLGLSSNLLAQTAGPVDSIVWTPDETLDCRVCPNPVARPTETTTYYAEAFFSKGGRTCSNKCSITIEVLNNCDDKIIYVPNTFTPNGDGLNDLFMIRGIAATKINYFRIFDRWGKLLFEAKNGAPNEPKWGWDGTDMEGKKLNPAVFVYTYEIECINGDVVNGKGNITLVR